MARRKARAPLDCTGCHAPCCRRIVLRDEKDRGMKTQAAREQHDRPGAKLMIIGWEAAPRRKRTPVFRCSALEADGLCGIYPHRPDHCRDYDCRDDEGRMHGEDEKDRPHCEWPHEEIPAHYSLASIR